jgi:hypothetical protein
MASKGHLRPKEDSLGDAVAVGLVCRMSQLGRPSALATTLWLAFRNCPRMT